MSIFLLSQASNIFGRALHFTRLSTWLLQGLVSSQPWLRRWTLLHATGWSWEGIKQQYILTTRMYGAVNELPVEIPSLGPSPHLPPLTRAAALTCMYMRGPIIYIGFHTRHGDLCLSSFYFFISSTLICLLLFYVVLTTSNKAVEAVPHAFSTSLSPYYQKNPVFRDIYPFISWRTACNRVWTSCRHFKLPILSFWFLRSCGSKSCPNGYYAITPARVFRVGQIQPSITKDQGLTIRHLVYKQFVPPRR